METIIAEPRTLVVEIARTPEDVFAAQRLRHEVFAVEMGARVVGHESGLDLDRYDPHCTHLLVREGPGGRVVACLRLLAAYLRLGARVCGEPSWDPEFGTADFFVLVSVQKLAARYARRFFGQQEASCAS